MTDPMEPERDVSDDGAGDVHRDAGPGKLSPEDMAAELDRHPGYRVLRRASPIRRDEGPRGSRRWFLGVALACGRDAAGEPLTEIGLQRFWSDDGACIRAADRPSFWPCRPGTVALPTERADRRACRLVEAEAASILMDADLIVSCDAAADRPLVEGLLPCIAGARWVDVARDVDWVSRGVAGNSLTELLTWAGLFRPPGGASAAAGALLRLLDLELPGGGTVLGKAVAGAGRPGWLIEAGRVAPEAYGVLAERGYRWEAGSRLWRRTIPARSFDEEYEWVVLAAYGGRGAPRFREVGWRERHARPTPG